MREYAILLDAKKMPDAWYNVLPDLPTPAAPVLHPATQQPVGPDDLSAIFPMGLIEQEMRPQPEISTPARCGPVPDVPAHAAAARTAWKELKTPAKIYYKNESVTPSGSHKINTSIPRRTTTWSKASAQHRDPRAAGHGLVHRLLHVQRRKVYMVRGF